MSGVDRTTLLALAERCEKVEWADRELDADIACVIGRPLGNIDHWLHGDDISYRPTGSGYYVAVIPAEGGETRNSEAFKSSKFTGSLDAAMTLVPTECFWRVGHDGEGRDPSMFAARVFDPLTMKQPCTAVAETAALALTAACLRAIAGGVA